MRAFVSDVGWIVIQLQYKYHKLYNLLLMLEIFVKCALLSRSKASAV